MTSDPSRMLPLSTGDFIEIPAWAVTGCVMRVDADHSGLGSLDALDVLVQESPDAPADAWRRYRLEPDEYRVLD
jgi:hypothetical protein